MDITGVISSHTFNLMYANNQGFCRMSLLVNIMFFYLVSSNLQLFVASRVWRDMLAVNRDMRTAICAYGHIIWKRICIPYVSRNNRLGGFICYQTSWRNPFEPTGRRFAYHGLPHQSKNRFSSMCIDWNKKIVIDAHRRYRISNLPNILNIRRVWWSSTFSRLTVTQLFKRDKLKYHIENSMRKRIRHHFAMWNLVMTDLTRRLRYCAFPGCTRVIIIGWPVCLTSNHTRWCHCHQIVATDKLILPSTWHQLRSFR